MTAADWGILVPAVAGCLIALTAYLKSRTVQKQVQAHEQNHVQS